MTILKPEHENGLYEFFEEYDRVAIMEIDEVLKYSRIEQTWTLINAARIKKVWSDYSHMGFVRDSKAIDEFSQIMVANTCKLRWNTIMVGHTERDPADEIEEYCDEHDDIEVNDDLLERFCDYIDDTRFSDYALEPLCFDAMELLATCDDAARLLVIDRMLNRVHCRGDIAALFIEGGSRTLTEISIQ